MTDQWRPLPGSLKPEVAYLVRLLRELKDRSGLSLGALATKTAYSKSSWGRYLNGTALPPRAAVEALGRLTGEPVERLVALWEQAETRSSGRADLAPPPAASEPQSTTRDTERATARARPRPYGRMLAAGTVCALAVLLVALGHRLGVISLLGSTGPTAPSTPPPVAVGCHLAGCAGQDADGMACDIDARSFASFRDGTGYVELRISDRCGAAWARVSHSTVGDQVQVVDQEGRTETRDVPDTAATSRYLATLMIPADRHSHVRACLRTAEGRRQCSPWGGDRPVAVPPPTHLGARSMTDRAPAAVTAAYSPTGVTGDGVAHSGPPPPRWRSTR